jgi:hypothetical protein
MNPSHTKIQHPARPPCIPIITRPKPPVPVTRTFTMQQRIHALPNNIQRLINVIPNQILKEAPVPKIRILRRARADGSVVAIRVAEPAVVEDAGEGVEFHAFDVAFEGTRLD